jgi:hypothetical protein
MVDLNDIFPPDVSADLDALDKEVASRRRQTLGQLLEAWYGYGEILSSRRTVHLDDFVAMLLARDALNAVVGHANPPTRRVLEALLSHADSRFFAGTVPDQHGVLTAPAARPGWWWHRIPESYDATGTEPGSRS